MERAERVLEWCLNNLSPTIDDLGKRQKAKELQLWLHKEKCDTPIEVAELIIDLYLSGLIDLTASFLAAFEAKIREYLLTQTAEKLALWLARAADKPLKPPPDSLQLSIDLHNQLQSRSGKAWDGYKQSDQPKVTDGPSSYEEQKAHEDGWE